MEKNEDNFKVNKEVPKNLMAKKEDATKLIQTLEVN